MLFLNFPEIEEITLENIKYFFPYQYLDQCK